MFRRLMDRLLPTEPPKSRNEMMREALEKDPLPAPRLTQPGLLVRGGYTTPNREEF